MLWLEGGESKWIYYATAQLAVADVATGEVTRPARIDRWFYYPKFAPDGSILALVEQDRDTWLARIDPASGHIEYLTSGKRFGSDFAVAPNGRVALLESDVSTPAELFAVDGRRQLTHHNAWTEDRAHGEVRDVSFASGDAEIHGYVTLPAGFDPAKRYPLLAYLHGGPVYQHSHEFDLTPRLYAAAGYAVLSINPRGSSGRGFDFSRAIYADWGNLDAQDISAGITHAIESRHRRSRAHRCVRLELWRHPHRLHDRQRPADQGGDLRRRRGERARYLRCRHVCARICVRARHALGKLRHLGEARLSIPASGTHHRADPVPVRGR